MEDKANTFLYFALFENALKYSDKPGELGQNITGQIRELIGGRTVIMFYNDDVKQKLKLMAVSPERRLDIAKNIELIKLAEHCLAMEEVEILDQKHSTSVVSQRLTKLGVEQSICIPLSLDEKKIGVILIHDIFSDSGLDTVLNTLKKLSGIFALAAKNAMSFQSLVELNATKDKFFSIIAHDLKIPFNSILGFSEILHTEIINKNYDDIEKYSRIIQTTSNNAFNLLQNLLEWSRSQTGKIDFHPEYFLLSELVDSVIDLLENVAEKKGVAIIKVISFDLKVYADRHMIETVIRNLISNSIKYTTKGGDITISANALTENIQISISDTGVGIPPEKAENIFQITNNSSTLGTNNEKGTGLGLILCKEFIDEHNGKIWVNSEIEKGSTFYFTIPNIRE
ncbi:MAG: HAMP domain-containing histidine kinase [Bacteroidetes bacterium]|nr:HAMP domain-containing histidine kinase [Bacteroidota bacterium]